jgi:protein phosphatase
MSRPAPAEATAPIAHRRRFRWKPWLIAVAILAVVVGALGGTYAWTQTQYFVGRAGEDVAIFQGVNADFGPLKFYNVYKVTDIPVSHLNANLRPQVGDGITATSLKDAQNIVENLRKNQLTACLNETSPPPTPIPPPTTSASPSSSPTTHTSEPRHHTSSSARHHRSQAASGSVARSPATPATSTSNTSSLTPSPNPTCPPP